MLADKVVVITGGTGGIGGCTARHFAEQGARIAILSGSSMEKAQTAVDKLTDIGCIARPYVCNVCEVDEINAAIAAVVKDFGTIDVLVNSAGCDMSTTMGELNEPVFDKILATNLKGTFFTINAVTPIMKEKGYGKIVNISAMAADMPLSRISVYCAAKSGVNTLTRTMAWELGPHGINCNGIAPGNTLHGIFAASINEPMFKDIREWQHHIVPSARPFLTPDQVAMPIVFLASDAASGINGVVIPVDLGMTAGYDGTPLANLLDPALQGY